ncbi:MAG TPA: efflux RND transporter periplasmic adaptor subunit [Blastocatellia bacterium]|jgi:RND family efflux transporter, MFP subunit|nr:efflux RND transporter periplasmic adaptor subunit [Blastocatellia bacterium]
MFYLKKEWLSPILFRLPIVITISLFVLFTVSCSKTSGKAVDNASPRPLSVRVLPVEQKQVRRNIESVGSLFPLDEVTVSSEVEGRVDQVLVDVGDHVSAGQTIVKVVQTELQLTLDQQRASLQQARARLGLQASGDDLKDVRTAPEVKKAAADLADAEQKYVRAKTLYEQGLLPKQNFDEAESRHNAARAAYDLSVQAVENLRAQLAQSKAATSLAQKKVGDSMIRAPFAGQVKERSVTQGQYLKVQTPVMVIVNVDPMRVRLRVPEKMAAWVKTGQEVTVSVEAYPGRAFTGKITRINPSVDQQTRAFEVEALIDNREALLKPGFFVKATIPSSFVADALIVPQDALLYVYGVYKVFVIDGNTLKEREVKIGERTGDEVEIVEGLSAGERVALAAKGQDLKEGAVVEVVN